MPLAQRSEDDMELFEKNTRPFAGVLDAWRGVPMLKGDALKAMVDRAASIDLERDGLEDRIKSRIVAVVKKYYPATTLSKDDLEVEIKPHPIARVDVVNITCKHKNTEAHQDPALFDFMQAIARADELYGEPDPKQGRIEVEHQPDNLGKITASLHHLAHVLNKATPGLPAMSVPKTLLCDKKLER